MLLKSLPSYGDVKMNEDLRQGDKGPDLFPAMQESFEVHHPHP